MKARIKRLNGDIVVGTQIQTRGDDTNFPTFVLEDGSQLGTTKDHILDWIEED